MAAFSSSLTTALASPRGRGRGEREVEREEDMGSTYIKSERRKDANRQLDGKRMETESVSRW